MVMSLPGITKSWIHHQHHHTMCDAMCEIIYIHSKCSLPLPFRKRREQRPHEAARCRRGASHARDISRAGWAARRKRDASPDLGSGDPGIRVTEPRGRGQDPGWRRRELRVIHREPPCTVGEPHAGSVCLARVLVVRYQPSRCGSERPRKPQFSFCIM